MPAHSLLEWCGLCLEYSLLLCALFFDVFYNRECAQVQLSLLEVYSG